MTSSRHGLSFSLLLEIESLDLVVIANARNSDTNLENSSLNFHSSRTTPGTKISTSLGSAKKQNQKE